MDTLKNGRDTPMLGYLKLSLMTFIVHDFYKNAWIKIIAFGDIKDNFFSYQLNQNHITVRIYFTRKSY